MKRIPKTRTVFGVKCILNEVQMYAPDIITYDGHNDKFRIRIETTPRSQYLVILSYQNRVFSAEAQTLIQCEREIYRQFSKYAMSVDETLYALSASIR